MVLNSEKTNEMKRGEKRERDTKPVALVALPDETPGWPLALGAARGFLYYSKYLI